MKIVATVKKLVQIGPDNYDLRPTSKVFGQQATIWDILYWADELERNTSIADIAFSNYDGEHPQEG